VFYSQYVLAEGGVKFLRQSRIQIPERISVCLLGGPKWVEMSEIRFAHILQPGAAMGQKAADIVFAKLENNSAGHIQEKIESELHVGDSIKDLTI
jgi:DNA-binding LacI/PurR family transcriptional regulator